MTGAVRRGDLNQSKFLVVEDHEPFGRSLQFLLRPYGGAVVAGSTADAMCHVDAAADWRGFVVDVMLPDGNGLDVLQAFREAGADAPAIVTSGHLLEDEETLRRAFRLKAAAVPKPFGAIELVGFLNDVAQHERRNQTFAEAVEVHAAIWRLRWGLSPGEAEVLSRSAQGQSREQIARARGVSELTVKTQVSCLLEKTSDPTLPDAVARLLREVAGKP